MKVYGYTPLKDWQSKRTLDYKHMKMHKTMIELNHHVCGSFKVYYPKASVPLVIPGMAVDEASWKSYFDLTLEILCTNSSTVQYITSIVCMPGKHQTKRRPCFLPSILWFLKDSNSFSLFLIHSCLFSINLHITTVIFCFFFLIKKIKLFPNVSQHLNY